MLLASRFCSGGLRRLILYLAFNPSSLGRLRRVSPCIGDYERCRVVESCWHRVPDGSIANQALCCGIVEPAKQARVCGREKKTVQ